MEEKKFQQLTQIIKNGDYSVPSYLTESCKSFIKGMIEPDPEKRMTIDQALNHPWIATAPSHRCFQSSHPLQISLKKIDRFFERDTSEKSLESLGMMRSCSTVMISVEDTVREICSSTKSCKVRQTARPTTKKIIFTRKSLPIYRAKTPKAKSVL